MLRLAAHASSGTPTFNEDVLPIFEKNCQVCHRPGEIGPMSLVTYEATRPWAKAIKESVLTGTMPPWFADPRIGHFANERRLTEAEVKTIVEWVDRGAPEGDPRKESKSREWNVGWSIKPDVVYGMPTPYPIPASGPVDYIYVLLPAKFTKDTWIIDGEIQPGNRAAVHHASVIVRPPGSQWMKDAKVGVPYVPPIDATQADGEARANAENHWLLGYAPGMYPQRYFSPGEDAGRLIPAGSDIFLEVHYGANGTPSEDQTQVGFVMAKQPPKKQLLNLVLYDATFEIPPNASQYSSKTWGIVNEPVTLVFMQPHLHMRGTTMEITVTYPDGRSETLISVPRYNYLWQVIYIPSKPLKLPKGTRIDVSATWDNSPFNPHNPDPSRTVRWGPQSWEEMMVAILGVTADRNIDPRKVLSMWWNVRPGPAN